jgi:ADP-heptose:LPS heptosyltransferase
MNILITRHDKIGDFITALPMCKVLKEQTNHKIVMLVSKVNEEVAKNLDFIDDVIVYEKNRTELLKKIKSYRFDISISAYIDFDLGVTLFLAKIPIRVAPKTKIAQIFFNKTLKQRRSLVKKTEWQYNLDLLKVFDENLNLSFTPPLLKLSQKAQKPFVIFHPGSGGSSDGNLKIEDYINLAKSINNKIETVFTFGPDDQELKQIVKNVSDPNIKIRDNFNSLWDFTKFIATSRLFVSTSTGPMHLAGLTNTPTLSFFGENLFASSKRWATVSEKEIQNNYEVPKDYDFSFYKKVLRRLQELIS